MANSAQDLDHVNIPTDIDGLCVPPNRRHAIPRRIAAGDATLIELLHHALGAGSEDTLTGGLSETQVLAEFVADSLEGNRHLGTLARAVANRLAVLTCLSEQIER